MPQNSPGKKPHKSSASSTANQKSATPKTTSKRSAKVPAPYVAPTMTVVTIFDTETTGLIANRTVDLLCQPEVIEFYAAMVDLKTGGIICEYDTLIKPTRKISETITRITGLTDADVINHKPFSEHSSEIIKILTEAPVVIAHNFSFDKEMIEIELERLGMTINWPRAICTVEQTLHIKRHRLNLSALHQHLFGEPFAGAHRAKEDVRALTRCCVRMHVEEMI